MKTRVGRKIDIGRLGSALKRPGIDTRCWVSLAVALEDSVVDPQHGVFVDVRLVPTEEEETARVGAVYAGNGFGLYRKIAKDDELLVLIPSGETAEGAVVLAQLHNAVDLPPQQAIDNPEDLVLVVEQDKNLRMTVSGAGKVFIESEDAVSATAGADFSMISGATALIEAATKIVAASASVLLGSDAAAEALVKGTTYRTNEATMNGTLNSSITAAGGFLTTAGLDPTLVGLAPLAAAALASAGGSLTSAAAAIATFEASAAQYLSQVSKTD